MFSNWMFEQQTAGGDGWVWSKEKYNRIFYSREGQGVKMILDKNWSQVFSGLR